MFGSVKITKNADLEKYKCSGDGIGFDYRSEFSLTDSSVDKNVISFGVDMSSSVHVDNKNKYILMLCKGTTRGLDNTTLTAEAKYFINFSRRQRKFCSSLHYDGSNNFLFINATKIYQFQAKNSEIKPYPLCLGNNTANNMKKNRLNGYVYNCSGDYKGLKIKNSILNVNSTSKS